MTKDLGDPEQNTIVLNHVLAHASKHVCASVPDAQHVHFIKPVDQKHDNLQLLSETTG